MPAKCIKMKMKQGMSAGKAVAACYPNATKAVKKAAIAAIQGVGAAVGVRRAMYRRAIKKTKPKKLSIRKTAGPIERRAGKQRVKGY